MKKKFLSLLTAVIIGTAMCSAQVTSHSSNDANIDGTVNISDVNSVLGEMYGTATEIKQVVSADDFNARLKSIEDRLAVIEKKLGIDPEPTDTHAYVDLGLPSGTLWATCNVGADSPEDYGDYFAWGETTGYSVNGTGSYATVTDGHSFNWSSYKWCNGSGTTMTKYCTDSSYGTVDNKTELEAADDAATVNWGSNWQMPSYDQIKELCNSSYTTTTWTTQNGVNGRLITSNTNGNTIFLPGAGCRDNGSLYGAGSEGYSWSRTLNSSYSYSAFRLYFDSFSIDWYSSNRCGGRSVRPVRVLL